MGRLILSRLGVMILTALCLTFAVFVLTNLHPSLEKLAKTQVNTRMTDEQVELWLAHQRLWRSILLRYGEWLGVVPGWTDHDENGKPTGRCVKPDLPADETPRFCGVFQGDFGFSTVFHEPVGSIIAKRLALTGWLMLWVMVVMVPMALLVGVLAGMREGSRLDRALSMVSIASTATPEYVSGVVLIAVFASTAVGLQWFKASAASAMDDMTIENFTLPVLTMALYGMGYIARMTRAAMAEVMTAQYIRTAHLKGLGFGAVVAAPRLAQRADRAVHRHHAAVPVAADRRRHRRGAVQLQGIWLDPGARRRQQRHRPAAVLLHRRGRGRAGDAAHLRHRLHVPQSAASGSDERVRDRRPRPAPVLCRSGSASR